MEQKEHNQMKKELEKMDAAMLRAEKKFAAHLHRVHPSNRKNALNLLHYLVLRSTDIRELQESLHATGLSSLASSESHIRGQLLSILQRLGNTGKLPKTVFKWAESKASLKHKSEALFGSRLNEALPYIMVTFDSQFADDYNAVKALLQAGMNVARINCAHDDESTWLHMIENIKRASKLTGLNCKIYMDLPGPKIRTVLNGFDKLKIHEGQLIFLKDAADLKENEKDTVGCTIPGIVKQLKAGEKILFDDGIIESRVEKIQGSRALLKILRISSVKPRIKTEKGINFPDTQLQLQALTDYDKKCLPFVLKHSDMVGYSFVRNTNDLDELRAAMGRNKKKALILKIETPEGVSNLPHLLFNGLHEAQLGVMIARGDLAVEIGFERMSEIQEEILWICEAAHVPVIWATQVLETLNKTGVATRSEITDAAHSALADCVMLNKGEHILKVMDTLKDVLIRSGAHHVKKRYTFRPLKIASNFINKK